MNLRCDRGRHTTQTLTAYVFVISAYCRKRSYSTPAPRCHMLPVPATSSGKLLQYAIIKFAGPDVCTGANRRSCLSALVVILCLLQRRLYEQLEPGTNGHPCPRTGIGGLAARSNRLRPVPSAVVARVTALCVQFLCSAEAMRLTPDSSAVTACHTGGGSKPSNLRTRRRLP